MKIRLSKETVGPIKTIIKWWEKTGKRGGYKGLADRIGDVSWKTVSNWHKKFLNGALEAPKKGEPHNIYSKEYNQRIVSLFLKDVDENIKRYGKDYNRLTIKQFKFLYKLECSVEHIRKVLIQAGIFTARTKRATKKKIRKVLKEKMKKAENTNEVDQIKENLKIIEKYKPLLVKKGDPGHVVEIDACLDWWVNGEKQTIYFAVDAFTNTLLAMWVEKEETTFGYIILLKQLFYRHGIPAEIRTDKRRTFYGSIDTQTHVHKALIQLGVKLLTSSQPTFKPNVERAFQNAQNYFPGFYKSKGINTEKEMQENIEETIKAYNEWNNYSMPEENAFFPADGLDIENIMTLKDTRVVSTGNVISLNDESVAPFRNNKRWCMVPGATIEILFNDQREVYSLFNGLKFHWKKAKEWVDVDQQKKKDKIEHEKKKMHSFYKMLEKQKIVISKKIEELQKLGVEIDGF